MRTQQQLEQYFTTSFPELLKQINGDETPLWGEMNLQQMLEHIALPFMLARGVKQLELATPPDKVDRVKHLMLLSDKPMPKGFNNPALAAEFKQLRYEDVQQSLTELITEVQRFISFYKTALPEYTALHNIFGDLNYHEWLWFNYKHVLHHLAQFGVVSYQDKIV